MKHAVLDELELGRLFEIPLRGVNLRRLIHVLVHRDKHWTPAMRAFKELLAEVGSGSVEPLTAGTG